MGRKLQMTGSEYMYLKSRCVVGPSTEKFNFSSYIHIK